MRPPAQADRRMWLAGAAATLLAAQPARSAERASRRRTAIVVNSLGQLENPNLALGVEARDIPGVTDPDQDRRNLDRRAIREALASGLTAVNVTLASPTSPFEQTVRQMGAWDQLIRATPELLKVVSARDIRRAKTEGKIGVIFGLQNGAPIGDRLDRIDLYGDFGLRVFQLTYNPANQIGDGASAPQNRGLTPFGRQVVERLNARRMMVDLSHSGERTCLEAARASRQPVSINHTGCRALADLPRNKTDEELRLVASRGGYVGIYFMAYLKTSGPPNAEDVVSHIDHAVNVCGEDGVGIGTDGTITPFDDLQAFRAANAKDVAARRAAGVASTETADTFPFVTDLRGPDQFHKLARLLRKRGYRTARVEKILGLNFVRYAETVWGS
jgi:membrane dipeptidase